MNANRDDESKLRMSSGLRHPRATLAAILAGVVVFALANPFCCHLLPHFEAEPGLGEVTMDEVAAPCPGKPEAVTEPGALHPDFVAVTVDRIELDTIVVPVSAARLVCERKARPPGPPRWVLFGVFLI